MNVTDTKEQMLATMKSGLEALYRDNTDRDFDATTIVFLARATGFDVPNVTIVAIPGIHPADVIPHLIETHNPEVLGLVCTGWIKDPKDTSKRIGENVMLSIETADEEELYTYEVTRDPFPVLGPCIKADHATGRLTGFLKKQTEH